jgi:hypothetical protein
MLSQLMASEEKNWAPLWLESLADINQEPLQRDGMLALVSRRLYHRHDAQVSSMRSSLLKPLMIFASW